MKIQGRVFAAAGSPVREAGVVIVGPGGAVIGQGSIKDGVLVAESKSVPVWGVLVDGRAVLAFPASADDNETVTLTDIFLFKDPIEAPVFHAKDGRVFGAPAFVGSGGGVAGEAPRAADPGTQAGLSFAGLLGSAARQIGDAARVSSGLNLTNATITLKGVPRMTDDSVSLDFPNAGLAATGLGLSQLSFTLKPELLAAPPSTAPAGPTMPDVTGYTRDLAARKLAPLGHATEFTQQIVNSASEHGRVVSTIPRPGAPLGAAAVIRLFLGKYEGS